MSKCLIFIFSFVILTSPFTVKNAKAQGCIWAKMGSGSLDDMPVSVVTDASGNVYSAGNFVSPTLSFGSYVLTNGGSLATNVYVVKYDPSGTVLWAKSFGGSVSDKIASMVNDASGNIYLYGMFESAAMTFGTTTLNNISGHDMFIAKLNSSGSVLWAKSERWGPGTLYLNQAIDAAADAAGNVYVTGYFDSSVTIGTTYLPVNSMSGGNIFIAKFDASGNVLWAKNTGGTGGSDASSCMTTDASGNVYFTGSYSGTITFDALSLTSVGIDNLFLVKYSNTGAAVWAKSVISTGVSEYSAMDVDAFGNIYVTGTFDSPDITFGAFTLTNADASGTTDDIFLVKYDASGNVTWAKGAGGNDGDITYDLVLDTYGNAFISGLFASTSLVFGTTTLSNQGMFVTKYSASGNAVWAKGAAGVSSSAANAIARDGAGNIYIAGGFNDASLTMDAITLTNAYVSTIETFTAKYSDPTLTMQEVGVSPAIYFYPDPVQDQLTICTSRRIKNIVITNLSGQIVYERACDTDKTTIDVRELPASVYCVTINHSDIKTFVKR